MAKGHFVSEDTDSVSAGLSILFDQAQQLKRGGHVVGEAVAVAVARSFQAQAPTRAPLDRIAETAGGT
ncbi:MAG: hypothetical protein ACRBN8_21085 [Nannocystales bacterium]